MPTARNDTVRLRYRSDGEGDETVVFVPDAGAGAWQWAWQAPAVAGPREAIVYYPRGTGPSDAPSGLYTLEAFVADLEAVLADHGVGRATLVGAGFGGLVALAHTLGGSRTERLVLLGSAASGDHIQANPLFAGPASLEGLLGEPFRREQRATVERIVAWRRDEDAIGEVAAGYRAALAEADLTGRLYEVSVPTLVLHGDADPVVPVDAGRALAEDLPRGEFDSFRDGYHWFFIERSRVVNDRIEGFLVGDEH